MWHSACQGCLGGFWLLWAAALRRKCSFFSADCAVFAQGGRRKAGSAEQTDEGAERGGLSGLKTLCSGGEWQGRDWCARTQGVRGRQEVEMFILEAIWDSVDWWAKNDVGCSHGSDGWVDWVSPNNSWARRGRGFLLIFVLALDQQRLILGYGMEKAASINEPPVA